MKRAVLLTGHFPHQKRKASMMWISDHLQHTGWHVTLASVGYSWLSVLRRDKRLAALPSPPRRGAIEVSPSLTAVFSLPLVHPVNAGHAPVNRVLDAFYRLFTAHWAHHLCTPVSQADLVICESGPTVLLAPILARFAPDAPRIYRVNDDIRLLNAAPALIRAEKSLARTFTRISTASPVLAERFAQHPNVTLDPMGIPHAAVMANAPSPYTGGKITAVCAGTTQIDLTALARIATARPHWDIHLLGRLKTAPPRCPNLHWHGETSFDRTIAYIAHADIGLAPYVDTPGVEYQTTNSNRMLLYRHFGLPILGPDRLTDPAIPSIIGYGDPQVWSRCETHHRRPDTIPDWSELAVRLTQNGVTEPPSDVSTDPFKTVKARVKTVPAFASSA